MKTIRFLDTTLRDGEQTPGVNLNCRDKVRIARELELLGVDVIEAGFPASSEEDFRAVQAVSAEIQHSAVAALARTLPSDIDRAYEAVKDAAAPRIHVFIATSAVHMKYKLRMTPEEVYQQAVQAVEYAKSYCGDVEFSPEDAGRTDHEFLYRIVEGAINAGATVVNIPDTVGYTMPEEFGGLIRSIREHVPNIEKAAISVHCHNDLGLATANSLAAVLNGAEQVECTINGIGERAGNTALEEVVMGLYTRRALYNAQFRIDTTRLTQTSRMVSAVTGVNVQPNKAIVGPNAFSHESGIHQHGVLAERSTYEIITPEAVGLNANTIVLGKLSGRHAFEDKLAGLGYHVEKETLDKAFAKFKGIAERKREVYDDEIIAIIQETLDESFAEDGYFLEDFSIQSASRRKGSAMVTLRKNGVSKSEAAIGEGPIDASFNAINRLLDKPIQLEKYNIKAVTEGTDALGEVYVKIRVENEEYVGRGVSADIIEASVKAYVNAVNRSEHGVS